MITRSFGIDESPPRSVNRIVTKAYHCTSEDGRWIFRRLAIVGLTYNGWEVPVQQGYAPFPFISSFPLSVFHIYTYIYIFSLSLSSLFPRSRAAFEIEDGFNKVLEIFIDSKNFSPIKGRFIRWKCRRLILSPIYPPIEPTRLASSTRYFHDLIFYSNFLFIF